ncbi:MAG: primase [Streptomyces oryziradicis]|nr:primase [Actinacidiphila oryziradicis]
MTTPDNDLWAGFDDLTAEDITGPMWDEPVPLSTRRDLPPFPVDALPEWLGAMMAAVAEETQTPVDLAGCLALAVVATAAGGRATVCVRGSWREPVNLYTAVALDPGNRKSAVFALMVRPLLAAERTLVELSGPVRAEAETTARLAKAAADKAAAKAANAEPDKRDQLTAEAVSLAQSADEYTIPARPQLVTDDVTPESLGTLLYEQRGRISVLSAEGDIFDIIAGRYSGKPNLGIFLKGHAGDMVRVNRMGRDGSRAAVVGPPGAALDRRAGVRCAGRVPRPLPRDGRCRGRLRSAARRDLRPSRGRSGVRYRLAPCRQSGEGGQRSPGLRAAQAGQGTGCAATPACGARPQAASGIAPAG